MKFLIKILLGLFLLTTHVRADDDLMVATEQDMQDFKAALRESIAKPGLKKSDGEQKIAKLLEEEQAKAQASSKKKWASDRGSRDLTPLERAKSDLGGKAGTTPTTSSTGNKPAAGTPH